MRCQRIPSPWFVISRLPIKEMRRQLLLIFLLVSTSRGQHVLNRFKGGSHDVRKDASMYLEQERAADVPIWLQSVSEQCQESYDLFQEHWRDPLLFMGRNSSQLWAPKSEYSTSYHLQMPFFNMEKCVTVADAYTALPLSGQFDGNKKSAGGYSSCKEITVDPKAGDSFQGRHCQISHIPIPVASTQKSLSNPLLPDPKNMTLNLLEVMLKDVRIILLSIFWSTLCR